MVVPIYEDEEYYSDINLDRQFSTPTTEEDFLESFFTSRNMFANFFAPVPNERNNALIYTHSDWFDDYLIEHSLEVFIDGSTSNLFKMYKYDLDQEDYVLITEFEFE